MGGFHSFFLILVTIFKIKKLRFLWDDHGSSIFPLFLLPYQSEISDLDEDKPDMEFRLQAIIPFFPFP